MTVPLSVSLLSSADDSRQRDGALCAPRLVLSPVRYPSLLPPSPDARVKCDTLTSLMFQDSVTRHSTGQLKSPADKEEAGRGKLSCNGEYEKKNRNLLYGWCRRRQRERERERRKEEKSFAPASQRHTCYPSEPVRKYSIDL